jgi:hypothetical protein
MSMILIRRLRVFTDELGLIYIMICRQDYPQRCAHMGLEELKSNVSCFIVCLLFACEINFFPFSSAPKLTDTRRPPLRIEHST